MANYMKQVAEMLGVEMGEEFEVDYGNGTFATVNITNTGLHIINTNKQFYGDLNRTTLDWILGGVCHIKRRPWKPTTEGIYYYVENNGDIDFGIWDNDYIDLMCYKLGNCYRTSAEAANNKDKWIAFYDSDKVLEV